jgi:hypothetical protein
MDSILLLLTLLFTKHYIVDFPLQTKFQWSNKGTYGHPGGVLHAILHGIGTHAIIYLIFSDSVVAFVLGLIDAVVHYHIDWAKMNLNARYKLGPTTSEKFWWLVGLDQYLHALTYIGFFILLGF